MSKLEVLSATNFGQRIAENEAATLNSYFVETEQWRKVISGQVDVIYGPKGSGKSALYALLRNSRDSLIKQGITPTAEICQAEVQLNRQNVPYVALPLGAREASQRRSRDSQSIPVRWQQDCLRR